MESANIVGYNTTEVKQGKYSAFAVQFETVDQTDMPIKDLFSINGSFLAASGVGGVCDQIWLWDSATGDWVKYFYQGGRGSKNTGWTKAGQTDLIDETETVKAGQTVFFYRQGADAMLTLAGGVKPFTGTVSSECAQGKYTFLGYPWPMAFSVSDFTKFYANGATPLAASGVGGVCDQIWLWDSAAGDWVKYFYQGGRGSKNTGWTKAGETELTADTIPVGTGFFFYRQGATCTISFAKD